MAEPRIVGYARPSPGGPDAFARAEILQKAGASPVLVEKSSLQARRALTARSRLLEQIVPGDTLLLTGLEQLGTSFDDVVRVLEKLVGLGVTVKLLDTGAIVGGARAEGHGDLLRLLAGARSALHSETIKLSLAAARAKGGKAGGIESKLDRSQWPSIMKRIDQGKLETVAGELGVSRQTLWNFRRKMTALDKTEAR
jgi:DNA invertase Pin-like site-specific DNA recombinase